MRWVVGAVLVAAVAGCTAGPTSVSGQPGPLTAPTGTAAVSRPAPVQTPSGTAVLPTAYGPETLTRYGVTMTLPVPADWSKDVRDDGVVNYGDPSGRLLLRLDIRQRSGDAVGLTPERAWVEAEPEGSKRLANYRRIAITAATGPGDSAADWTFTFDRGVRRQVVSRAIFVGAETITVYFSTEQTLYESMLPVFDRAMAGLTISRA
jgi:eukaryotic-like serine/threonine-protein kinase